MMQQTERLSREDLLSLETYIEHASRITIAAHTHPDGDAIGSCIGLLIFLRERRDRQCCRIVLPDSVPETLSFAVSGFEQDILTGPEAAAGWVAESDLVFLLDCPCFSRTEGLSDILSASRAPKILVDHHIGPDRTSFDLTFSETEISSASELIYSILTSLDEGRDLPPATGRALLTGMTTDTNNFANSVYPSTLRMASELLRQGVDRDDIIDKLYHSYRINRLQTLGYLLHNSMEILPGGAALIILTQEIQCRYQVTEGETEGFVNMPLSVGDIRLSIFLKETTRGHFRVSVRSSRGVSANALARTYFHGGGHENAAGGKLFFPEDIPTPGDAAGYVRAAVEKFFAK